MIQAQREAQAITCRLCAATCQYRFNAVLMQHYDVAYFECSGCRSLQTETPYWLEEANANPNSDLDTGRAQRSVLTAMLCTYILGKIGLNANEPCLDWGGAEGLFCRFMRDRGFNCYTYDKYVKPLYSAPYRIEDPAVVSPAIVSAFEVFEHLPEPARELGAIFALGPRLLLCSTELYEKQGNDWMYLSAISGRHCFFYSTQAMEWIASRFGYRYIRFPFLHVFAANEVWERPELRSQGTALDALSASKDTLMQDAGQSMVNHLTGEAWRYIARDYFELRKTRLGVR